MRVLWIEDELDDVSEYVQLIQKRNCEVVYARDVAEAMIRIDNETFDAIILDLKIPLGFGDFVNDLEDIPMNGQHLIPLIRSGKNQAAKILCLTNFPRAGSEMLPPDVSIIGKVGFIRELEDALFGGGES